MKSHLKSAKAISFGLVHAKAHSDAPVHPSTAIVGVYSEKSAKKYAHTGPNSILELLSWSFACKQRA